ncbi:MAG: hypothetical protein J0L63_14025 [Anaerolineae bacterium]|nr:hypothetical protein [Anaerolineae bacterium]
MRQRSFLILMLVVLALMMVSVPVSAGTTGGVGFSIGCEGFSGNGSITLNRDNTGLVREAFVVLATDGVGNIIYEPVIDSFFVGGSVSWEEGDVIVWDEAPSFNPISLRVVSLAGNDLPEQTVVVATGSCVGLPTYGALPTATDASVSPSVGTNEVPPRPNNADVDPQTVPGFLLVNTDNLSLRSGDGPQYTRVGIVDGGTILLPLGRNRAFTWWLVQAGDLVGWAKAEFLVARGDLTGVSVVDAEGEVTPPVFFVFSNTQLLAAPAENALPVCGIAGNVEYLAVGRTQNTAWYEVQTTCDNAIVKGWLPASVGAYRGPSGTILPVTFP